ncbi:MAG: alpha/beta hydrolase [Proteobacteria bacterium]|nr:alpha/beta hydrolase [Pseudomonadota bacterium]
MTVSWRRRALTSGLAALPFAAIARAGSEAAPVPTFGRVERLTRFPSRYVDARTIDVWLPADYQPKVRASRRFATVYMHDGQMLFDERTTWNHQSWHVDSAATDIMHSGAVHDFIVVGIWNNGALRHSEYFPAKFLPFLPVEARRPFVEDSLHGRPRSDEYLRFIVDELVPAIDARYATDPRRERRFLAGSSMGGLISLYGMCEYPAVFGGAACLSTHWIGTFARNAEFPAAAIAYLSNALPEPDSVRLWMDRGSTDLDALYDDSQLAVSRLLTSRGFAAPNFAARVFEGAGHTEGDWSRRVGLALRFLLATEADLPSR